MKTIEEFFTANPLGHSSIEYKTVKGFERFHKWLPEDYRPVWPCSLAVFALASPLTYWNEEVVEKALSILEADPQRTIDSIVEREQDINNGIDNLFRVYENKFYEESLDLGKTADILRLVNEIHPEYLVIAQHIFGNLLTLYWSVLKKKGVDGRFNLPRAVDTLHNRQADLLIGGYDDKVRNAIAHGQVYFRGLGIQYGEQNYKYELSTFEFFDRYDMLWRVSISLAIALLLFLARHKRSATVKYPLSIDRIIASSYVDRNEFEIKDYMVSELTNRGKQLNILVKTTNVSRNAIIMDCLHYAVRLFQLEETSFSRLLFDINYENKSITGQLSIDYEKLKNLLKTNATYQRVGEVLESTLLWYDEPIRILIIKTLLRNLRTHFGHGYWMFLKQQAGKYKLLPPDTYRIKQIKNSSAGGIARLNVTAVFMNPSNTNSQEKMIMVCRSIIRKYASHWMATNPSRLVRRVNLYLPPSYIWINLYKRDGTNRWLGNSGWLGGELVCVAEFIRGRRPPILVKQPDIIENNIRYQFSMEVQNVLS